MNEIMNVDDVVKFSVLTTVYNKEKHLAEAIQSVLVQSHEEFELIVVDDGSTDNSVEIAQRFASKDSRIKVYKNESNLGDYPNRNKAISLASFEHLKFLDADDVMAPHALRTYADVVRQAWPNEPNYYVNCPNLNLAQNFRLTILDAQGGYRRGYVEGKRMFEAAPNSCLYRKSVLERLGFFTHERQVGDYEMAHRLVLAGGVGIVETRDFLSTWRMHENQESEQIRSDLSVTSNYIRVSLKYLELAKDFFSLEELKLIHRSELRTEAQRLRTAIGGRKMSEIQRVIRNLNFPVWRVIAFVFKPYKIL